jgi:hypothetical protein
MKDGDIDYSRYTLQEMEEAFAGIKRDAYPLNYANLSSVYELRTSKLPPPSEHATKGPLDDSDEFADELPPQQQYDEAGRYVPNHIPDGERGSYIILTVLLLVYGAYGVWADDLYLPARRGGMHLHGLSAWTMYGAFVCACLVMLLVVADHYDRRENEFKYWYVGRVFKGIGWFFFAVSLILEFVRSAQS